MILLIVIIYLPFHGPLVPPTPPSAASVIDISRLSTVDFHILLLRTAIAYIRYIAYGLRVTILSSSTMRYVMGTYLRFISMALI